MRIESPGIATVRTLAGVVEDEVAAGLVDRVAGGVDRASPLGVLRVGLGALEAAGAGEQRGAREARAVAAGAGGEDVGGRHLDDVTADLAAERAGTGQRSRRERLHTDTPFASDAGSAGRTSACAE